MRKISILAATILAACGSSSSPPTYALMDAAATQASGSCTITGVGPIGASVAVVVAADYTGACTSMTTFEIPGSGVLATLVIARVDISSITPPPLNTGTYKFYDLASATLPPADPANPLNGFKFFAGPVDKCAAADAGGGGTALELGITGGTVEIDAVSPLHGTLSATIAGGTTIGGSFTAPTCATAPALDVATLCAGVNSGGLTFPPFTCQ
jgi:hypothetical protein